VQYWCIGTATLESILAKIPESDESAASRRKAAAFNSKNGKNLKNLLNCFYESKTC
jgi:hypothetical protein